MERKNKIFKNKIIIEDMESIYARGYNWEQLEGKRVFVTGAYGMLASYVIFFLLYLKVVKDIQIDVIAQGRSEVKARRRFGDFFYVQGFSFTNIDIINDDFSHFSHIDYIVHAAGMANPQYYITNPVEVIEPNAIGTYHMLQIAKKCETEGFLFFSTGDVYGKVRSHDRIDEATMGYMDPLDEHSCYGESKRLGETLCSAFFKEYGVRTVMARIGHTYGPTMDINNDPRVFSSFMEAAVKGDDIVLHSDGSARRPFCYISDATAAYMLLLLKGKGGEAYNVTNTDQFLSIWELAQIIAGLPEGKPKVLFKERSMQETYLNNDLNQENKPIEDKLKALGWKPEYDARSGFLRVYNYFKDL